jgi:hypothetical protein
MSAAKGSGHSMERGSRKPHVQLLPEHPPQVQADVLQNGVAAGVCLHLRPVLLRHVLQAAIQAFAATVKSLIKH